MRKKIDFLIVFAILAFSSLANKTFSQCLTNFTEVNICIIVDGFPEEIHWLLISQTGDTVSSADCGDFANAFTGDTICTYVCLENGVDYQFQTFDDWGDGWNGGSYLITRTSDQCVISAGIPTNGAAGDESLPCDGSDLELAVTITPDAIAGCTDQTAVNFNPCAVIDDGSCILNDICVDAIPISCGQTVGGSTTGSTTDSTLICNIELNTSGGIWYKLTGTGDSILVSLCESLYDTKIGIFTGSCSNLQCIAGNDDDLGSECPGSLQSSVKFYAGMNTTYYLYVTGFAGETGNFTLSISCDTLLCAVPQNLTSLPMGKKATFSWDPVPEAVSYQLIGSQLGFSSIPPVVLGTNSFTTANTLKLNTSYYWTVKAICPQNLTSEYAAYDTFMTQGPCGIPAPLFENNITAVSANLNWQIIPDAIGYRISGRQSGTSSVITIDISNGSQSSFNAGSLMSGVSYEWTAQAFCPYTGFSLAAPISTFTTLSSFAKSERSLSVDIYPNPVDQEMNIEFPADIETHYKVWLTDISGRTLMEYSEVWDFLNIDVRNLSPGQYHLWAESDGNRIMENVIVY